MTDYPRRNIKIRDNLAPGSILNAHSVNRGGQYSSRHEQSHVRNKPSRTDALSEAEAHRTPMAYGRVERTVGCRIALV
jgi:hypothetical protein